MPLCKLCGDERLLIGAHIIPRAFYDIHCQDEGPIRLLSNREGEYPRRSQTGVYDEAILCEECDKEIGRALDEYATDQLLRADSKSVIYNGNDVVGVEYTDADPNRIFRFVASVAWRASVCSHEFFGSVRLGPYEDIFKSIILDNGFRLTDCPQSLACHVAEFDLESVPFLNPHYTRFDEVRFLLIYAARFCFYLKVDRRPTPEAFREFSLGRQESVVSVGREWGVGKERSVMRNIVNLPRNRLHRHDN